MKPLAETLRDLTRADVAELAMASDRLPCVKIAGKYEPISDKGLSSEAILEVLVAAGGSRYLDDLEARPAAWSVHVAGIGSIGVQAVMRGGRLQARFVVVKRAPPEAPAPAAAPAPAPATHDKKHASKPAARKSMTPRAPSRKSIPALRLPKESKAPPPLGAALGENLGSDPLLRPAVIKPPPRANVADAAALRPAAGDVDALLAGARSAGASDLHLVAGRPPLLRLAGELVPRGAPLEAAGVEAMVLPMVPERLAPVLAEQGSCDFAIDRGASGRFRVNVGRQRTGLKACFRLVPPGVPTLESLGLPPEIEKATHHHQGLVVVTGPTGHGKTCTLAAIVDIINRTKTHHIITVEDPVEVLHPRKKAMVSQREIGAHTRSFASALKASLREDPDVIVVGELRDTETVRMALAASETGHLVLGTMNTPSAAKTIDRLIDLFPPGDQAQVRITLAGGLHLVVSQRLLPRADGRGMVAAVELLPGSVALWSLIRDSKTFQIPSLQQRGRGFGILRLDESLADLVRAGKVTRDAALAVAEAPGKLGV